MTTLHEIASAWALRPADRRAYLKALADEGRKHPAPKPPVSRRW